MLYELLDQKFKLFDGVFGSSDEVLGSIESGVELEKRIVEIYRTCRTAEEIQTAFDALQRALEPQIEGKMLKARQTLLENFDDEVLQKVRMNVSAFLSRFEKQLWLLTNHALEGKANFDELRKQFALASNPYPVDGVDTGTYHLARHVEGAHLYRIGHPLAQAIISEAKEQDLGTSHLIFNCSAQRPRSAALEPYIGKSGWLQASALTIDTFESEDYILMAARTDDGEWLSEELAGKLMLLNAETQDAEKIDANVSTAMVGKLRDQQARVIEESEKRNGIYFDEEMTKLDKWADDKKTGLEIQIKDIDKQIRLYKSEVRKVGQLVEKVKLQREIKDLEKKRSELRNNYFTAQDEIDIKKEQLIGSVEARMKHNIVSRELFTIRFSIT